MVGENDGTGARLGGGRLDLVGGEDALGLVGLLECVPEVVVADGADVGDRVGGEDVLWRQQCLCCSGRTEAARAAFWAAPPAT